MRVKSSIVLLLLLVLLGTAPAWAGGQPPLERTSAPQVLELLRQQVQQALDDLDQRLAKAAEELGPVGLEGPRARQILRELSRPDQVMVNTCLVDAGGRIVAMEPPAYRRAEGQDIGGQEQVKRLLATGKPVLSHLMPMVEGFEAVDLEHPVLSPQGALIGSVSVLIRPSALVGRAARWVMRGTPYDAWAMETNGRIIYDADQDEVGLFLFEDPMYRPYPQLLELGRRMARQDKGAGGYVFLDESGGQAVRKDCLWVSVGLHGSAWRLVLTRGLAADGAGPLVKRGSAEAELAGVTHALEALARDPRLALALTTRDWRGGRGLLAEYFQGRGGVYCVQFCDARGVVRLGYPATLSLEGHDFSQDDNEPARRLLEALNHKAPAALELTLRDGRQGAFLLRPVRLGDDYLGMLYVLRIKP